MTNAKKDLRLTILFCEYIKIDSNLLPSLCTSIDQHTYRIFMLIAKNHDNNYATLFFSKTKQQYYNHVLDALLNPNPKF